MPRQRVPNWMWLDLADADGRLVGGVDYGTKEWPTLRVRVEDARLPFVIEGDVAESGHVSRLELHQHDGSDVGVSPDAVRSVPAVTLLRRWATLRRDIHRLEEAGVPPAEAVYRTGSVEQALQAVAEASRHSRSRQRLRGPDADDLLVRVVAEYRTAVAAGDPAPRTRVGHALGYSNAHVGRLLVTARRRGLLGPPRRGKAGESTTNPGGAP